MTYVVGAKIQKKWELTKSFCGKVRERDEKRIRTTLVVTFFVSVAEDYCSGL